MDQPRPTVFVTRDLTTGENILQAGWAKRGAVLLDRLQVDGRHITLRRRDGSVDELEQGEFRCTTYRNSSKRRIFVIKTTDGRKISFMEMDGMLSAEEWDTIADEVLAAQPSQIAGLFLQAGWSIVIGMLAAALATGFVGGMFHLKEEQLKFSAPLSLGMMAVWSVIVWLVLQRLRRGRQFR
ncbi:MAG TPA: hypothetical protein VMB21_02000 [Candidatus Limnocylindria bacterium]|nr:hypothetical protein [Candidatus Limnocylindria bacterium]